VSNIKFTKEQIQTLSLDPNYAIEQEPKEYINKLRIYTENAIRYLEPKIQNTFRYLASKQMKHILKTNRHNMLHKRYQYNIKQLRKILQNNKLMIVKADKSKAIVIINENTLEKEIDNFIQENNIKQLNKDLTDMYQKQIQQTLKKCNALVDIRSHRYLVNVKPTAPKLNIYIIKHKDNEPIRPVVNNTLAPSYNIAKIHKQKPK